MTECDPYAVTISLSTNNAFGMDYSSLTLVPNVGHRAQMEFIRVWELPDTSTYSMADLDKLYCIHPEWVTLTESTTTIDTVVVPNPTTITIDDGSVITIPDYTDGEAFTIRRRTKSDESFVSRSAGGRWTATQFNLENDQIMHILQEVLWRLNNEVIDIWTNGSNNGLFWQPGDLDMLDFRIINLGDPVGEDDAVNLSYLEANYLHKVDDLEQDAGDWVALETNINTVSGLGVPSRFLPDLSTLGGEFFYQDDEPTPPTDHPAGSMWVESDQGNRVHLLFDENGDGDVQWVNVYDQATPAVFNILTFIQATVPTDALNPPGIPFGSVWFNTENTVANGGSHFFRYVDADADHPNGEDGWWVDMTGADGTSTFNGVTVQTEPAPTSPTEGLLWFNLTDVKLYCWTAANGWVEA